jgi:hypothetical protein
MIYFLLASDWSLKEHQYSLGHPLLSFSTPAVYQADDLSATHKLVTRLRRRNLENRRLVVAKATYKSYCIMTHNPSLILRISQRRRNFINRSSIPGRGVPYRHGLHPLIALLLCLSLWHLPHLPSVADALAINSARGLRISSKAKSTRLMSFASEARFSVSASAAPSSMPIAAP